jgi:hypothetical protein
MDAIVGNVWVKEQFTFASFDEPPLRREFWAMQKIAAETANEAEIVAM